MFFGRRLLRQRLFQAILISLVLCLPLSAFFSAADLWETKPYLEWSVRDVDSILNNSPWVALRFAGFRTEQYKIAHMTDHADYNWRTLAVFYRVQLLSARPIQEAVSRRISLGKNTVEYSVSLKEAGDSAKVQQELDGSASSSQNTPILQMDKKFIVIAIVLRITPHGLFQWSQEPDGAELTVADLAQLKKNTRLSTNVGKIVSLFEYKPPGRDWSGARFYFSRTLPNGQPLVTSADEELSFETFMNRRKIRVKFELRKMLYRGKLEL